MQEESVPQGLCILGSTGSVGSQTLEVARLFPERLRVRVLTARRNVALLAAQAAEFRPDVVVIDDQTRADALRQALEGTGILVLSGREALRGVVVRPDVDTVVAAMVGVAGLESVIAAVRAGKKIALANKEALVVAGELVNEIATASGSPVIPVDSEHSAIFQCLVGESRSSVERLILTASGGPFRTRPLASFDEITRDEALDHPNWNMGQKISIDSATMMNKGLEVVEAHWLFGVAVEQINVLVHPQSIIHSMVVFRDGSTKAQLGLPDMKMPIQYALSYPSRWSAPHERIDWSQMGRLDFEEPDLARFPCLALAYEAIQTGGTAPAVLNAANEQAVALFLRNQIRFTDIPDLIGEALAGVSVIASPSLRDLIHCDGEARSIVLEQTRARTI